MRVASLAMAMSLTALAGCSGSQGVAPRSTAASGNATAKASASLKVTIPAHTTTASTRRAQYVSPATQSISASFTPTAGGSTQTFNENLTPASNPNCNASLISPEVCTVTFSLAPGAYTATFATYDGLLDGGNNPTGNVLSQNQSVAVSIVAGQPNSINVTLQGAPTSVALIPAATSTITGSQSAGFGLSKCFGTQSVSVIGIDADGNYILGPGAPTPSLTSSDTTQLAVTAPTASAPNTLTLTRPGIPNANASITLTATVTPGSGGGTATSASVSLTFDATICGTISEYAVPTSSSAPSGIASGPDGALWFLEEVGNNIGRISTTGAVTEYAVPTSNSFPSSIASGPDGALWFTEAGTGANKIGRVSTSGVVTEYAVPTSNSSPFAIVSGPDGALWFTAASSNKIGRISTSGAISEYPVGLNPRGVSSGADGALWVTEASEDKIGRISTSGALTQYPIPTPGSFPFGIASGMDGALWFTEYVTDKIGRISTSGAFTEYPVPTSNGAPTDIAAGLDGALWFTEAGTGANKIGRISPSGTVTEYAIPTSGSVPTSIASGPDGALWFTEQSGNKIGRLQ